MHVNVRQKELRNSNLETVSQESDRWVGLSSAVALYLTAKTSWEWIQAGIFLSVVSMFFTMTTWFSPEVLQLHFTVQRHYCVLTSTFADLSVAFPEYSNEGCSVMWSGLDVVKLSEEDVVTVLYTAETTETLQTQIYYIFLSHTHIHTNLLNCSLRLMKSLWLWYVFINNFLSGHGRQAVLALLKLPACLLACASILYITATLWPHGAKIAASLSGLRACPSPVTLTWAGQAERSAAFFWLFCACALWINC